MVMRMPQCTIGKMDPFDLSSGGNWCRYAEQLEQYFVANGTQEDTKQAPTLVCVMGEKPYKLVHNLLAPAKMASKKYKEIVDAMTKYLQSKPLIIAEHLNLIRGPREL